MADVVLVATVLGFFGLCVLYVRFCDRMIRHDDIGETVAESPVESAAGSVDGPMREAAR